MKEKFCDFCECSACVNGESYLSHSRTIDGKFICDVCYSYDVCVNEKRKLVPRAYGPCKEKNCEHRPKLVGEWKKYERSTNS